MATSVASSSNDNDDFADLLPMPSEDWDLHIFLKELADEIDDEELKTMKFYLRGFGGSGKKVLESIKHAIDFFEHLQHRCLLNRNNLLLLQALIWHLKRKDLHEKLVKFAKKIGNALHFYNTKDKPVNGYEFLHFHIAGQEKMNRNKLERLRSLVSRFLCIPPQFVVNTDIESTNSILVTFMVPEGYSNIIRSLDADEKGYFASMGIDVIVINEEKIKCKVSDDSYVEQECITMDSEIKHLLDQKAETEKEMEALQVRLLHQEKVIRKMQSNMHKMEQETQWRQFDVTGALIQQYVEAKHIPEKGSLQELALRNAQKYFQHTLRKAQKLGYDSNLLCFIIEANTTFIRMQTKSYHDVIVSQQNARIRKLQQDVTNVCYQRDKLAYYIGTAVSKPVLTENEEFFLKVLGMPFPFPFLPGMRLSFKGTEQHGEIDLLSVIALIKKMFTLMETFERSMTEEEKESIKNKFVGSSIQAFKDSKLPLLRYIWTKEVQTKGQEKANLNEMMTNILRHIKRLDMLEIWKRETERERERRPSGKQEQPSHHFEKGKRSTIDKSMENKVDKIDERLGRMEDMLRNLTSVRKDSSGLFDGSSPFGESGPFTNKKLGQDLMYEYSKLFKNKLFCYY